VVWAVTEKKNAAFPVMGPESLNVAGARGSFAFTVTSAVPFTFLISCVVRMGWAWRVTDAVGRRSEKAARNRCFTQRVYLRFGCLKPLFNKEEALYFPGHGPVLLLDRALVVVMRGDVVIGRGGVRVDHLDFACRAFRRALHSATPCSISSLARLIYETGDHDTVSLAT